MDALIPKLMEQGVVVMAFIWLLKYTLETATSRENRLMDFMDGMKQELHVIGGAVNKLADDMDELKQEVKDSKQ
jgi:hypothetical protein